MTRRDAGHAGKMLYFGKLREIAGGDEAPLPLAAVGRPVSALIDIVARNNPGLGAAITAPSVRICVNHQILNPAEDPVIASNDEVAFLPPMSGG